MLAVVLEWLPVSSSLYVVIDPCSYAHNLWLPFAFNSSSCGTEALLYFREAGMSVPSSGTIGWSVWKV